MEYIWTKVVDSKIPCYKQIACSPNKIVNEKFVVHRLRTRVMPWLKRLDADLSRRTGFNTGCLQVRFLVEEVSL